jgi:hypothetical protein
VTIDGQEIRQVLQKIQGRQGLQEVPQGQALTGVHEQSQTNRVVILMKVAVVSEDFRSLSGPAGKARRFLVFEVEKGRRPVLEQYFQLPADMPTHHDLHEDDHTFHPIDGMVLIAAEAGEGFRERLARRGTPVHITSESDPHTAVALLMDGRLPSKDPTPKSQSQCG